jgi:tRNA-splicing ligase RtcB
VALVAYPAKALGEWLYEIPKEARADMRVGARVYADQALWQQIGRDRSLEQLVNVATMPGIAPHAYAMPDAHEGYGFPVGGVAAFRAGDGVISPGGVGYDINCGVRLLASDLVASEVKDRLEAVVHDLSRTVPSGAGRGGALSFTIDELDQVLSRGSRYLAERGLASAEDVALTEAFGSLEAADPDAVSPRAKQRGHDQVGTVGSGNHFIEVQEVDEVFDAEAARCYGVRTGQLVVLIHTGSRGLGHQVCTDYVREMDRVMPRYDIRLPDRQLACAPFRSAEGRRYFGAMCAAANFAWANRQGITHLVRKVFTHAFGEGGALRLVYDVCHNIAKVERYGGQELVVHRKGATRAFGRANPETPEPYRAAGQPVFIPGSMGTASYVLAGEDTALERSFGSTCHGAGRAMSRSAAKRAKSGQEVRRELESRGIIVRCPGAQELAEEQPAAYKDVERVVEVVHHAGLARKVARLRPLGVVKG